MIEEAGIERLVAKQYLLTGYAEYLLDKLRDEHPEDPKVDIITPRNPRERGCHLAIKFKERADLINKQLLQHGIMVRILVRSLLVCFQILPSIQHENILKSSPSSHADV